MRNRFMIHRILATILGTIIFVLMTRIQIPTVIVPNTSLQLRAALLAAIGAIYGPIAGGLVGFAGHAIGDYLYYGKEIWWSWVVADAFFGIVVGLLSRRYHIRSGEFEGLEIALFSVIQMVGNILSWIIVAPILDILIYNQGANRVFVQGAIACICNIVTVAILGTLLCMLYSRIVETIIRKKNKEQAV